MAYLRSILGGGYDDLSGEHKHKHDISIAEGFVITMLAGFRWAELTVFEHSISIA